VIRLSGHDNGRGTNGAGSIFLFVSSARRRPQRAARLLETDTHQLAPPAVAPAPAARQVKNLLRLRCMLVTCDRFGRCQAGDEDMGGAGRNALAPSARPAAPTCQGGFANVLGLRRAVSPGDFARDPNDGFLSELRSCAMCCGSLADWKANQPACRLQGGNNLQMRT